MQKYQKNKYLQRIPSGSVLKLPTELPEKVAGSVTRLRLAAIYLDLKPLFYNSMILDYRTNYKALAEFLGIGGSTFRAYCKKLLKTGLATSNGAHLQLCSWKQFREIYGIETRKVTKIEKQPGQTTYLILRALVINNNLKNQEFKFWRKYFAEIELQRLTEQELVKFKNQGKINLPSKERFTKDLFEKVKKNKFWKKYFHSFIEDPANYIRAVKKAEHELKTGNTFPEFNPVFTLSCKGIARQFGRSSPGSGYYWTRKLEEAELMRVTGTSVTWAEKAYQRQSFEGINNGSYKCRTKRGKNIFFRTLPNLIRVTLKEPELIINPITHAA